MTKSSFTSLFTTLIFLFVSILTNAQTQFEKGYFIDNNNNKTECLIRNLDWKNNPDKFSYKLTESSSTEQASINTVKKFEIFEQSIYVRSNVEVLTNTTTSNKLDHSEKLDLKYKDVFLKLLVGGKSNLYMYKDANFKSFYYQLDDDYIRILEYKEYINQKNQVSKNQQYKIVLWNTLKCNSITMNTVEKLNYNESQLTEFMASYNTCMNDLSYTFKEKKRKNAINLSIRPGISFGKASIDRPGENFVILRDFDFDKETSFRFGVELEYILPFNNDKWALIFEPTYQYYKTEKTYNQTPSSPVANIVTSNVDYSSIELPLGIRHYSYISSNSRLFLNFSAILDMSFKSETQIENSFYESDTGGNLAFGLGYSYKNKYSIEARLYTKRELLNKYSTVKSQFSNMSLILGYNLF